MPTKPVERDYKCFGCGKELSKTGDARNTGWKTATCGNKKCWAERQRWANITRRYGITREQYYEMLNKQNGVCAICENPESIKTCRGGLLYVDHRHSDGKVRKLLCNKCNNLIGDCYENTEILQKAINYLNKENQIA